MDFNKILKESDRKCYYCGSVLGPNNMYEMEHVIPKSLGGSDGYKNIVAACKPCNHNKGTKLIKEWRKQIIATTGNLGFKFHFELMGLARKGAHKYMDLIMERPDLMEKYGLA